MLVTTSNRAPRVWHVVEGKLVDQNMDFGESAQKIVWAELRESGGPLLDSGFSGLRRQFDLESQPPQPTVMRGHYADVNRIIFGPYGTTIFTIDDRGILRVRSLDDKRDLFGFKVPALTGIGEGKVNEVRDFALQCQYDINNYVKKCVLAVPLADRPAVALYDLDLILASDRLFPDSIETGLPDSIHTCPGF
jgi:hypothetical protein